MGRAAIWSYPICAPTWWKGYLARSAANPTDDRSIFGAGPDMDLVSVAEQAAFKQEWLGSLDSRKTWR